MEDILSSIRKIINEEASPLPNLDEDDDILELTQEVQEDGAIISHSNSNATTSQIETIGAINAPVTQQEDTHTMTKDTPLKETEKLKEPQGTGDSTDLDHLEEVLVSRAAADASVATLAALSRRVSRRKEEPIGEQTVDQLMRSILKPLIREWLDDHLPQVVERIVSREVTRLVQRSEYDQY